MFSFIYSLPNPILYRGSGKFRHNFHIQLNHFAFHRFIVAKRRKFILFYHFIAMHQIRELRIERSINKVPCNYDTGEIIDHQPISALYYHHSISLQFTKA